MPLLKPLLSDSKILVEPFAGSGVVHLNRPLGQPCIVADANQDLINTFKNLQERPESFIAACRSLFTPPNNTKEKYLELRSQYNASRNAYDRAVYFVYLNRHSYNGLVRYNQEGVFNVPFGMNKIVLLPESEMRLFNQLSLNAEYICADFRTLLSSVDKEQGMAVYCDPPYLPLPGARSSFTSYHGVFDENDHAELASFARRIAETAGAVTVVSNSDSPVARDLYHGAEIHELIVRRRIASKSKNRLPAKELLAVFRNSPRTHHYFDL